MVLRRPKRSAGCAACREENVPSGCTRMLCSKTEETVNETCSRRTKVVLSVLRPAFLKEEIRGRKNLLSEEQMGIIEKCLTRFYMMSKFCFHFSKIKRGRARMSNMYQTFLFAILYLTELLKAVSENLIISLPGAVRKPQSSGDTHRRRRYERR